MPQAATQRSQPQFLGDGYPLFYVHCNLQPRAVIRPQTTKVKEKRFGKAQRNQRLSHARTHA